MLVVDVSRPVNASPTNTPPGMACRVASSAPSSVLAPNSTSALSCADADREAVVAAARARRAKSACSAKPPPFCSVSVRLTVAPSSSSSAGIGSIVLVERELLVVAFLLADEARRVLALLEVGVVAVQRAMSLDAHIEIAAQRDRRRHRLLGRHVEHRQAVLGAVGAREDRFAIQLEQILGRGAVADEIRVDARQAHVVA